MQFVELTMALPGLLLDIDVDVRVLGVDDVSVGLVAVTVISGLLGLRGVEVGGLVDVGDLGGRTLLGDRAGLVAHGKLFNLALKRKWRE